MGLAGGFEALLSPVILFFVPHLFPYAARQLRGSGRAKQNLQVAASTFIRHSARMYEAGRLP